MLLGYLCAFCAALCWGSNYTVVKKYSFFDGAHFQFLQCQGIFLVGLGLVFLTGEDLPGSKEQGFQFEFFYPAVLVGGLWTIGNQLTVSIINYLGLATGFSLWSGTTLLLTFLIGKLALFGLEAEVLDHPEFAFVGVGLGLASLGLFCMIEENPTSPEGKELEKGLLEEESQEGETPVKEFNYDKLKGVLFCLVAGCCYSVQFVPVKLHMLEIDLNTTSSTKENLKFYTSQFFGIFLSSFTLMIVKYLIQGETTHFIRGVPWILSVLSGVVWAVGCLSALFASVHLGLTVGFPLCSNGAFIVNNLWSYFWFKEIQGARNKAKFVAAVTCSVLSSVSLTFSHS